MNRRRWANVLGWTGIILGAVALVIAAVLPSEGPNPTYGVMLGALSISSLIALLAAFVVWITEARRY